MTQVALASALGIKQSYIAQLETGARKSISFEFAAKIGEVFGLPMNHFAPFLAPNVSVPPPPSAVATVVSLPVAGYVSAGGGVTEPAEHGEVVAVPVGSMPGAEVVYRCRGASMVRAGIMDGDYLGVRRTPEAEPGQIAVVRLDDNGYVVKLVRKIRGKLWLVAMDEHDQGEPIKLSDADEVIGVVTGRSGPIPRLP